MQVDSGNFDDIQNIISNILDTTTKVRINGIYHTIDKSNKDIVYYGWQNSCFTVPCFRPMFEFNQE